MCLLHKRLHDILMQSWKVDHKFLKLSVNFFMNELQIICTSELLACPFIQIWLHPAVDISQPTQYTTGLALATPGLCSSNSNMRSSANAFRGFPPFFQSSADFGCHAGPTPFPPSSLSLSSTCSWSQCSFVASPLRILPHIVVLTAEVELVVDASLGSSCHIKPRWDKKKNWVYLCTLGHRTCSFSLLISTHVSFSCSIYLDQSLKSCLLWSRMVELTESRRWAMVTSLPELMNLSQSASRAWWWGVEIIRN